jgi:hypothetical protein
MSISSLFGTFAFFNPYFSFNSVRFKVIWFYWGWRYTRATFWFIVCSKYGMDGTVYVYLEQINGLISKNVWNVI